MLGRTRSVEHFKRAAGGRGFQKAKGGDEIKMKNSAKTFIPTQYGPCSCIRQHATSPSQHREEAQTWPGTWNSAAYALLGHSTLVSTLQLLFSPLLTCLPPSHPLPPTPCSVKASSAPAQPSFKSPITCSPGRKSSPWRTLPASTPSVRQTSRRVTGLSSLPRPVTPLR